MATSNQDYGKSAYPAKAQRDNNIGSVTGRPTRTYTVDITVDRIAKFETDDAQEYVIRLNGHILTRMNEHRARRMGVIE